MRSSGPSTERLEAALTRATGEEAKIAKSRSVGGGCIHDGRILHLADGRRFFVKTNASPPPQIFE